MSDELPGYQRLLPRTRRATFSTPIRCLPAAPSRSATVYGLLDVTPKGRNEPPGGNLTDWVRRHDKYDEKAGDSCCHG